MQTFSEKIRSGDIEGVRQLVKADPSVIESEVQGAPSALLLAVYFDQPAIAELIRSARPQLTIFEAAAMGDLHELDRNAKVHPEQINAFSSDGFTPLGYAAFFGHLEAVRLLLDLAADPAIPSNNPMAVQPVHSAMAGGHKEMARLLMDRSRRWGDASGEGWTPLHYAAHSGDIEIARYLLENGADRSVRLKDGRTAAELAAEKGFTDLEGLLSG